MTDKEKIEAIKDEIECRIDTDCYNDNPREELESLLKLIDSLQEEPVSEDLEKAARKYAGIPEDSPHDLKYCVQDKKAKYDAVLYGANWLEQQLVKVAVEIPIIMVDKAPAVAFSLPGTGLKKGDRIKVIVFKK